MTERVSVSQLHARAANVNRRIAATGHTVGVQGRCGYYGLDEYEGGRLRRTLTIGTRRQVGDFLHAMMVGIDLYRSEVPEL